MNASFLFLGVWSLSCFFITLWPYVFGVLVFSCFLVLVWASIENNSQKSCASQDRQGRTGMTAYVIVGWVLWHQPTRRHFVYLFFAIDVSMVLYSTMPWISFNHYYYFSVILADTIFSHVVIVVVVVVHSLFSSKLLQFLESFHPYPLTTIDGSIHFFPEHHFWPFPMGIHTDQFTQMYDRTKDELNVW